MISRQSAPSATLPVPRHGVRRIGGAGLALLAAVVALVARPIRSEAFITFTPSGFVEETLVTGLPWVTGATFAPDGRLFITQKTGVVRVWQNGTLLPTPFVDISAQVADSNDRGLLSVAVHPNFPNTPYVYLLFTWNPPGYPNTWVGGRVSRLVRVEANPAQGYNVALPGSSQPQTVAGGPGHVILMGKNSTAANIGNPLDGRDKTKASCMTGLSMNGTPVEDCIPSDEDSHSIGTVAFGTDGSLFLSSGDGANYTDIDWRALRAQNLNSLAGKIMRIDPATGNGLADNPFFDATCPQCNRSKVYARGLRNPFRFAINPATNEPWIGDVGWTSWEEINTGKGGNFGWPCYEGGAAGSPVPAESTATTSLISGGFAFSADTTAACNALYAQGLAAVRPAVFAWNHDGFDGYGIEGGAAAIAGSFYTGIVYPPEYQDALFFMDFNRRWLRYLTFDAQGHATVHNFGRDSTDGLVGVLQGPDSNLYVVTISTSSSEIRRIRYLGAGNTPPTAVAGATPTIGEVPLTVQFSSQGTFDPDAQPLGYSWDFGDGSAPVAGANPTHTYQSGGSFTVTLTVTEQTAPFATRTAQLVVTVGSTPPLATITQPVAGSTYQIGDVITYSGFGTSGGAPLPADALSWEARLHHNEHIHFNQLPGGSSGAFTVIEHGDNTYYEICLTATVTPMIADTRCVDDLARNGEITLATNPIGLLINYEDEGVTQAAPLIVHPVVGSQQTASVAPIQGGLTFEGWADGVTSNSHPFTVGSAPLTLTANYVNRPPVAVLTASPTSGVAPLVVAFTGSSSSDPESGTLTYSWTFGDGATSNQTNPQHTYAAAGTYTATLTVTDQLNGVASQSVAVTVASPSCGNGAVEAGEACDGGACCTAACQLATAGTVCRAAAGACDVAETCSGSSVTCPANGFVANGTSCTDGNVCNGAETCTNGTCTAGTALVCNDSKVCTTDTCNTSTGCVYTNNTGPCSDGVACTADVCSGGACQSTPSCPGGSTCNLATGTCDVPAGSYSIWPTNPTPAVVDAGADSPVELGVKFRSDVAGTITAIRFYKAAANTGPHQVSLWSGGGTRLGTVTVNLGAAAGWQEVPLPAPVAIQANTTYVASYFCPNGHYSGTLNYFLTGVDTPPLHALASGAGNGVFGYGVASLFPTGSYSALNYWVDVKFTQQPAATLTGIAVSPAAPAVTAGGTQQFTATGTYSDGSTQNLTASATWASSSTAVATVTAGGLATGVAPGTTTISAMIGAVSGSTTLTVQAAPLTVTTTALAGGTVGTAYAATLAATGGTPPYTWSVVSGTLPAGLTLTASTGVIAGTPTTAATASFTVRVTAGAQTATKALSITVGAAATGVSIWPANPTPAVVDAGADSPVELGVKFRSDVAGTITAIRFYKATANTGPHQVSLWSVGGTRLGTATVNLGAAAGWQQVALPTPVGIQANTTYVASYFCPGGHYSATLNYFVTAVDTPPLHALASAAGNGVFGYGAASLFPTGTYAAANYWVDVKFSQQAAPALTSLAVSPATPTVTVGGTRQFTATGTYTDGSTQDLTTQAAWSSSSTAVATVTAGGLATGVAPGTATISATIGAVSGSTTLTVQAAPLTVTTTALAGGTVGTAYAATLAASGGTPPYTWSVVSGALPAGLTLTASTGVIGGTPTTAATASFTVRVTAGAQTATKALSITVGAAATGVSIWPANPTPAVVDAGADSPVELGVKFRSDVAGTITAIRFYKAAANTGPHQVSLWSVGGTRLGTTTVNLGAAAGWQEVPLAAPVAIQANTTYVASYFCPNGHYSGTLNYFVTAIDAPPLHALASGAGNGVFGYGAASLFPTGSYLAANYWIDVRFTAGAAPTTTTTVVPTTTTTVGPTTTTTVGPTTTTTTMVGGNGLVGHWQFDGSGGSAVDSSGNGNNGELINSTLGAGRYGDAVQLSGNNDSHVSIPASQSLNNFTNQITVTAWVFPDVAPQGFLVVASRQVGAILHPDQFYLGFGPENGQTHYKWHLGTNNGYLFDESIYTGIPGSNRWIHMAGTYDGSRMRLYVDGVEIGSKPLAGQVQVNTCLNWEPDGGGVCNTDNPVTIGGEENGSQSRVVDNEFDGRIDEVRLYNRALSAAEILTIYQQPPS